MNLRRVRLGIVLAVIMVVMSGPARALTDEEIFRDFRFNFTNPSARAMALGGAFIAAADDATAVQANPAAMHYLSRKEFFAEYRLVRPDAGGADPAPVGSLDPSASSPIYADIGIGAAGGESSFASFVAFALPFSIASRRATVAISRQVVLDVETSFQEAGSPCSSPAFRISGPGFPTWINDGSLPCTTQGAFERYSIIGDYVGDMKAEVLHYNLGFSYSLHRDFSVGVTATYATLDMQSDYTTAVSDPLGVVSVNTNPRVNPGGGFLPIQLTNTIDGTDNNLTYTIGIHWHPDSAYPSHSSPFRLGFVYRKGAELEVEETLTDSTVGSTPQLIPITLREPDRYGLGFSFETARWIYVLDIERIEYSDLLTNFQTGVNLLTRQEFLDTAWVPYQFRGLNPHDPDAELFTVDDATVFHAGAEYRFNVGTWTWNLRAGYYNAPDNKIRYEDVDVSPADQTAAELAELYRGIFAPGEDENHFTGGFSFSFDKPIGLQVGLAADMSNEVNEYLLSTIWRFGKVAR